MWNRSNLIVGISACAIYAILAFGGIKSPFGAIGKAMSSGSSGRAGGGAFFYGGGK